MKYLRKWYEKKRMKAYMIDIEIVERDFHDPDDIHHKMAVEKINELRALNTYEQVYNEFVEFVADYANGRDAVIDTVWVLVER